MKNPLCLIFRDCEHLEELQKCIRRCLKLDEDGLFFADALLLCDVILIASKNDGISCEEEHLPVRFFMGMGLGSIIQLRQVKLQISSKECNKLGIQLKGFIFIMKR